MVLLRWQLDSKEYEQDQGRGGMNVYKMLSVIRRNTSDVGEHLPEFRIDKTRARQDESETTRLDTRHVG